MNQYKDTTQTTTALKAQNKRQIDSQTKVTFHDVAKSILIAFFMVGLLLLISSYHSAYPKNNLPNISVMGQNKDLSKNIVSGQASRYSLAFFAPKYRLTSQVTDTDSATHHPKSTGVNRHIMPTLAAVYDGVTLQNSPFWVICRAVTNDTESEPHHPMTFHSVVSTQNQSLGAVNHD